MVGISNDDLKHLVLTGVKIIDCILGMGAYGIVFEVDYNGTTCAGKTIKSRYLSNQIKRLFLHECLFHSKLDHPNIVKMLGVYYLSGGDAALPYQVMELMEYSLFTLLEKS